MKPLNGYIAFYDGKQTEIFAEDRFKALEEAKKQFKPPKSKAHMVHVHLAEKGGEPVVHTPNY